MSELARVRAIVSGRVQGVFFRAFVAKKATLLGLNGYVHNIPGGRAIEVQAEGDRLQLEKLVDYLRIGPPSAKVEKVTTDWAEYTGKYGQFSIMF